MDKIMQSALYMVSKLYFSHNKTLFFFEATANQSIEGKLSCYSKKYLGVLVDWLFIHQEKRVVKQCTFIIYKRVIINKLFLVKYMTTYFWRAGGTSCTLPKFPRLYNFIYKISCSLLLSSILSFATRNVISGFIYSALTWLIPNTLFSTKWTKDLVANGSALCVKQVANPATKKFLKYFWMLS